MITPIKQLPMHAEVTPADYNRLADRVNALGNIRASGGIRAMVGIGGVQLSAAQSTLGDINGAFLHRFMKLAEVQTLATGDGVYNCKIMSLDATEWDDTAGDDRLDYTDTPKAWAAGMQYGADTIVTYSGSKYGCVTAHTSTAGDTPNVSNKWLKVYQWEKAASNWDSGHGAYSVDDLVIYTTDTFHYRCIVAHTAAVGKEPTNTTYWRRIWQEDDYVYKTLNSIDQYFKCTTTHTPTDALAPPDTTNWEPLSINEVLNLYEADVVASYSPALALYDRILIWKMYDDEGGVRWVGVPLGPSVRRVKATEAAPATANITCNLILRNGSEAAATELGYNIEVYGDVCGGTSLSTAVPRIANDDELFAINIQGKWWFTTTFQASQDCT